MCIRDRSLIGCSNNISNSSSNVFSSDDAIALVLKGTSDFPTNEGEVNVIEFKTGGLYPGLNVNADFTTEIERSDDDKFLVKLTKEWNLEINGMRPISYWIYEVKPNYISLVESIDMDYMISAK